MGDQSYLTAFRAAPEHLSIPPNKLPWAERRSSSTLRGANSSRAALYLRSTLGSIGTSLSQFLYSSYVVFISEIMVGFQFKQRKEIIFWREGTQKNYKNKEKAFYHRKIRGVGLMLHFMDRVSYFSLLLPHFNSSSKENNRLKVIWSIRRDVTMFPLHCRY